MNILVVLRQLPDLIEPLEIGDGGSSIDFEDAPFLLNEYDEHALEQGLLLKEAAGGTVTAVAFDWGDVDNTLYSASAKGADRIVKIPWEDGHPPGPRTAAAMVAELARAEAPGLVLTGAQAFDELTGNFAPLLAHELNWPYAGVLQGAQAGPEGAVTVYKEYSGARKARMTVRLPAVLGILTASRPPRYVPVSRVRAAMKSARFEECSPAVPEGADNPAVLELVPPETGGRAKMLEGGPEDIAAKLIELLEEKGVIS